MDDLEAAARAKGYNPVITSCSHNACGEALEGVTNGICESDTFNHAKHNHLQAKTITEKGHKNKHFQSYDDPLLLPVIQQHI